MFVVLLNVIGVLPGRTIVRSWRVVIVAVVVFCAVATPAADVALMFLLAVPLCLAFRRCSRCRSFHDCAAARRLARLLSGDAAPDHGIDRELDRELVDA